ncbi:MAG: hypothetical protein EOL88_00620 [Bacteroidia bacterium]|nr:hypothetical protein [Bacteroidia bacterium]
MFEIAIPSYKRANDCLTAKKFSRAVIYCHQFEVEEYKKYNDNKIVAIPDDLAGKGMAVIRNFILDNSKGNELVMLDDDIRQFGYYENLEMFMMTEQEVYDLFENNFRMAKELGTKLWGVNLQSDKKFYREYSPFSFSSVILGPCMGIIKDEDIRFDERLGLKEDYDYSIQALRKFRKVLRFNKYHYVSAHIKKKGGCASYRTMKKEEEQAILFQKKWGHNVVEIKRKIQGGNLSINPIVRIPINGI